MPGGATPLEEDLLAALDSGAIALYRAGLAAAFAAGRAEGRDRTVAFLRGQLRGWDIPVVVHRFAAPVSRPGPARLSLARRDAPVAAVTLPYSAPTEPTGLVAELRAVIPGEETALAGAIALVDALPTPALVARLTEQGAVAQVYISVGETPEAPIAVSDRWGGAAPIPVIAIGRAAGEGFLALCAAGATPVRLHAEVTRATRRFLLPVATIKGIDEADTFILVGAPGPTPTDGGEAAACLLELCRVFAMQAGRLRRGVRFVWWPQGATALTGPLWYVDDAWAELRQRAACTIALTPLPEDGGVPVAPWAEDTLRVFAEGALVDGGWELIDWAAVPPVDGEQAAFARLGLPGLRLPAAERDRLNACVVPLARLCTAPVLPFDFVAQARALVARVEAVGAAVPGLDFAPLRARAGAFQAAANRLQVALLHIAQGDSPSYEEGVELGNRLLRRLHRLLLPTLRHAGDPYATVLPPLNAYPLLPGLDAVLVSGEAAPDEREHRHVTAIRERNRAIDALDEAVLALDETLTALRPLGFG